MKRSVRRRNLLAAALLVALLAALYAWAYRQSILQEPRNVALALAIDRRDLQEIRRLILAGADANIRTDFEPVRESFPERLKRIALRRKPPLGDRGNTPLHVAAAFEDLDLVRLLLSRGADPEARAGSGCTPLHLASGMEDDILPQGGELRQELQRQRKRNALVVIKTLLDAGADPNAFNPFDGNPFRHAVHLHDEEVERLLLERGAKWNLPDRFGTTALWEAASAGRVWLVRKMLAEGANPNEQENVHRGTVLEMAVYEGHTETARLLIDAGARVNHQNREKETALHVAVEGKAPYAMAKLLLARGARPDLKDMNGDTPLDRAIANGDRRVIALLKDASR